MDEEMDDLTLHAHLDGELDPVRAAEVDAWLKAHPADVARLETWRKHDGLLRSVLDPVLDEAVPDRVRLATSVAAGRWRPTRIVASRAAAAVVVLAFGAFGGWQAREHAGGSTSRGPQTALAAQALDAHVVYAADLRHPVEVLATEREHLNAWLSRRVQQSIAAPDLGTVGYTLLGGRLLSDRGRPAALFMYEDAAGKRLTVFLTLSGDGRDVGQKPLARDDLRTMSWSEGPLAVAVTGDLGADRLRGIGEIVATSLKGKS